MFSLFPDFSFLTLEDKDKYEQYTSSFPPISDLSFATLMIWWGRPHPRVAMLNDNLVINYSTPGELDYSSLALVGTCKVDESMLAILSEAKRRGGAGRLIYVPEFVIRSLQNPGQFVISEEIDSHEYVIPASRFYPLETMRHSHRTSVRRFIEGHENKRIEVVALDLSVKKNTQLLMDYVESPAVYSANDPRGEERRAIEVSLTKAKELNVQNRCLFIDGCLKGFFTFQMPRGNEYLIGNHLKVAREIPHLTAYLEHMVGKTAHTLGLPYINMEMDLGIPGLRHHKQKLKPTNMFKKYRVTLKH